MNYSVTDTRSLRKLCNDYNLFTDGTNVQYEKLIYANSHGYPIEDIATIIWLCSEKYCRRYILSLLSDARSSYLESISCPVQN